MLKPGRKRGGVVTLTRSAAGTQPAKRRQGGTVAAAPTSPAPHDGRKAKTPYLPWRGPTEGQCIQGRAKRLSQGGDTDFCCGGKRRAYPAICQMCRQTRYLSISCLLQTRLCSSPQSVAWRRAGLFGRFLNHWRALELARLSMRRTVALRSAFYFWRE